MKDRTVIWVLEYIIGGILVVLPMAGLFFLYQPACPIRGDGYIWSTGLFIVSLGVILVSCASSMRQRMVLGRRIDKLAQEIKWR